jgi:hypothetical protein
MSSTVLIKWLWQRIRFTSSVKLSLEITGHGIGGDDLIVWDRRYRDQIEQAKDKFYQLIKKGFKAFVVSEKGQRTNRQLFQFDPDAEEIAMIAPQAAG